MIIQVARFLVKSSIQARNLRLFSLGLMKLLPFSCYFRLGLVEMGLLCSYFARFLVKAIPCAHFQASPTPVLRKSRNHHLSIKINYLSLKRRFWVHFIDLESIYQQFQQIPIKFDFQGVDPCKPQFYLVFRPISGQNRANMGYFGRFWAFSAQMRVFLRFCVFGQIHRFRLNLASNDRFRPDL